MRLFLKIVNIIFIVLTLIIIGFILGRKYDFAFDDNDRLIGLQYSTNEQKIRRLVSLIDDQYMEDINTDSLVDNAIHQIIGQLDPHSTYLTKKDLERVNQQMSGSFNGLGIQIRKINDTLTITQVLAESPNFSHLFMGDQILKIDSIDILDLSVENSQTLIKESQNEKLNLTIRRNGFQMEIEANKGKIPVPSVIASFMIQPELGYIKLIRFAEQSAEEVHRALLKLNQNGMKSLVFDLRGNPGGIMKIGELIADEFLTKNELIVYTEDKEGKRKYTYATSRGLFEKGKIYVLIDEGSASASEIVAGALQEYGRAILIGRRSYGKGLVQREVNLGDGTRVRLTVAHYYTPSGRSIQRPYDEGNKAYSEDLYRRFRNGELYHKDSIKVNKDLVFITPSGKTVYGGGGIIPDEFIPVDTAQLKIWIMQHASTEGNLNFFYKEIIENQFNPLWMNENWFLTIYDIQPIFEKYIGTLGIRKEILSEEEERVIKNYIRSSFAEKLFGTEAMYRAWIQEDSMIQRVLELENEN